MTKRGRAAAVLVDKGHVYLSNDKAERKASGSYYTPDPIVEYIVEHTVGPVLAEKLEKLRPEFRKVRKTFDERTAKGRRASPPSTTAARRGRLRPSRPTRAIGSSWKSCSISARSIRPWAAGISSCETVDFITDRMLTFLNQFPVNPVSFMLDRTRRNILEALGEQGVTVDPDKLTEVNLLKRHVLKRCIYGVDLNPMAVELAKVSLWLDAFTIGAPLSFLDHHLRCGNSLVGATFKDLEAATKGQLFGIDYEPLLRAIHHVIQVNKMADATAAEVKQSAGEYTAARKDLSGYQIVLDLLVAAVFRNARRAGSASNGRPIGPFQQGTVCGVGGGPGRGRRGKEEEGGEEGVVADLGGRRRGPGRPTAICNSSIGKSSSRRCFLGSRMSNSGTSGTKNEISDGSAGFDAVVGNPPYVRMELIKPLKPFLKVKYRCHAERADLFIYFYERALGLLKQGGYSAFIASSTWTKTKAGEGLREFLRTSASLESFVDFGDLPVFPEATTYPCVMVVRKQLPSEITRSTRPLSSTLENLDLNRVVAESDRHVATSPPGNERLELRRRIRAAATREDQEGGRAVERILRLAALRNLVGLERSVRDRCLYLRAVACRKTRRNREILKPFLEGKDLKPWHYEWRGIWLIYAYHGIEINRYPAIKAYLSTFRRRLEERATSENHQWYELQQPQRLTLRCLNA